jgi:hypothetical protein
MARLGPHWLLRAAAVTKRGDETEESLAGLARLEAEVAALK